MKKEEEQKSIQQLRGFWTNFARRQKQRREQQFNTEQRKQNDENNQNTSEYNCKTNADIEVHKKFPKTLQITKVATKVLENSSPPKAVIYSSKNKSESQITGSSQDKPGLEGL